jgi:hypothetical protein
LRQVAGRTGSRVVTKGSTYWPRRKIRMKFHREPMETAGFALTIDAKVAKLEASISEDPRRCVPRYR